MKLPLSFRGGIPRLSLGMTMAKFLSAAAADRAFGK
jgi:hypothetical protein